MLILNAEPPVIQCVSIHAVGEEHGKHRRAQKGIMKFTRFPVNPQRMGGVPCIRGLHIPVATVVGMVADRSRADRQTARKRPAEVRALVSTKSKRFDAACT